jgi:hypothetical protein
MQRLQYKKPISSVRILERGWEVELVHLGAYRAVQGSGLRIDVHLGLHRAAGQLKGRRKG